MRQAMRQAISKQCLLNALYNHNHNYPPYPPEAGVGEGRGLGMDPPALPLVRIPLGSHRGRRSWVR
jgi:hypothetical protein